MGKQEEILPVFAPKGVSWKLSFSQDWICFTGFLATPSTITGLFPNMQMIDFKSSSIFNYKFYKYFSHDHLVSSFGPLCQ